MEAKKRHQVTKKVTLVGALVNGILAFLQISSGLLGNSQALLADGIHTLSDLGSDFIVLMATTQSAKPADKEHPYGHGRIETLASVLLGLVLIGVGVGVGFRGFNSVFSLNQISPEPFTIFFAVIAICLKKAFIVTR